MNLRLLALKIYIPAFIRKKKLCELFQLTAHAFRCKAPRLNGYSYRQQLMAYAEFSRSQAAACLEDGTKLEEVKGELFQGAYRMGRDVRRTFCLRGPAHVMEMSRILYRILGIDFEGSMSGDVTIRNCFFSDYYSPRICRVMSALDEGFAAGLSDGGKLSFSHRITEGGDRCRARFVMPETKS
jgi:hypothetical protein